MEIGDKQTRLGFLVQAQCWKSPLVPLWDSILRRQLQKACEPPSLHNSDLCDLCSVGRPHVLQAKTLRLWRPRPGSLLLPRLRQQTQQSVPGPERTHPLPQRSVLAVRLPAVPLPGQSTELFRLTRAQTEPSEYVVTRVLLSSDEAKTVVRADLQMTFIRNSIDELSDVLEKTL